MKKLLVFCLSLVVVASAVTPVFAETNRPTTVRPFQEKSYTGSAEAMKEQKTENRIDNLQARAEKEINRRLESLTKLLTRINEFKKLSAAQKTTLTTEVQAQITALNTLLAKIKADTDPTVLKTDVQSIVGSYRIYALFIPQIQLIGAADRILSVADEMSSHAARLQTKITEAKTGGKDTTSLDALLTDMNAKIADAKTNAQSAIDTVTPLTPDGYPGNKTILQSARQMVTTAVKDLNTARQDGRKIIVGLMQLGVTFQTAAGTTTGENHPGLGKQKTTPPGTSGGNSQEH